MSRLKSNVALIVIVAASLLLISALGVGMLMVGTASEPVKVAPKPDVPVLTNNRRALKEQVAAGLATIAPPPSQNQPVENDDLQALENATQAKEIDLANTNIDDSGLEHLKNLRLHL